MMLTALAAAAATTVGEAERPIRLDNACEASEWAGAARTRIAEGVELLAMADEDHVYLCWTLPPESLGALDLYLIVPGEASRQLHVGAEHGERWLGPDGWSPLSPADDRAWSSPALDAAAGARAREMRLSRDISRAAWWLMFRLHAVGPGRSREIVWPAGGVPEDTRTWVELDLSE